MYEAGRKWIYRQREELCHRPSSLVLQCSLANFINAADRVIMPIAIVKLSNEYKFTLRQQGWILSAFSFGYISSQIVGSCAGAQFGGRRLLLFVVLMWTLSTLMTPLVAPYLHLLIFTRIMLGVGEGLGLPTMYHILAQTVSVEERSTAFGYLTAFGSIGQTFAAVLCPHLAWWVPFYLFGFFGFAWCLLWFRNAEDIVPIISTDQPLLCSQTPNFRDRLRALVTSSPLWAIFVAHFAMNWTSYIVMNWLPTYLDRTFHANPKDLSIASLPYVFNSICSIGIGHVADALVSHHKMSLIRVRKTMTGLGLLLPGLLLLWLNTVSHVYVAIMLISLTMGFLSLNSAGHLSNHADVCPRFAGISFAISNTIATIPGLAAGPLTAELVEQSHGRWFPVFILAGCLNLVGAVVYMGHASASVVVS